MADGDRTFRTGVGFEIEVHIAVFVKVKAVFRGAHIDHYFVSFDGTFILYK